MRGNVSALGNVFAGGMYQQWGAVQAGPGPSTSSGTLGPG